MAPGQGQNHSRLIPTESSVDRTKPPFVAGIEVCQAVALGSEAPMPECSPQAHDQGAALAQAERQRPESKSRLQIDPTTASMSGTRTLKPTIAKLR